MPERDRDSQGRAQNARPRDGLGRPLPHGSRGVERINEDMVLPPDESLAFAQRLLDEGRPFHAHEVLEAAWKTGADHERDLWKGLAQVAVGLTHLRRGNTVGAVSLLRRGSGRIEPYSADPPHGVPVSDLTRYCDDLADRVEHGGLDGIPESELSPRLR
jgi:hypothetical protein